MYINSNIKYLRKLKRLSQESFADRLGLNRGNVASYENQSQPPLEIILKISEWYNVSVDALVKSDLSDELNFDRRNRAGEMVKELALIDRVKELIAFSETTRKDFAHKLGFSDSDLELIFKGETAVPFNLIVKIINEFNWLSLDWLFKGSGAMVAGNDNLSSKVAEPDENIYIKQSQLDAIQNSLNNIVLRLNRLESE